MYSPGYGITSAGLNAATGSYGSTYFGEEAGNSGYSNTIIGSYAGDKNNASGCVFIGSSAGRSNTNGGSNVFIGVSTGFSNTTSSNNTFLGSYSGNKNTTGHSNTFFGYRSGFSNISGFGNVFIGINAGYNELSSNKLYIDNSNTTTPLIYGDFNTNKVGINTNQLPNSVGGANTSAYGLYVKGGILTEEVRVRNGWADYVFADDYVLTPIYEVESFISKNKHLPNVPSAKQVEEDGLSLGEISKIQQEKIEELTLYIIDQQKQLDELKKQVQELLKTK